MRYSRTSSRNKRQAFAIEPFETRIQPYTPLTAPFYEAGMHTAKALCKIPVRLLLAVGTAMCGAYAIVDKDLNADLQKSIVKY